MPLTLYAHIVASLQQLIRIHLNDFVRWPFTRAHFD